MKHARVLVDGQVHRATECDGQVLLDDGRLCSEDAVAWLPPLEPTARPRTVGVPPASSTNSSICAALRCETLVSGRACTM